MENTVQDNLTKRKPASLTIKNPRESGNSQGAIEEGNIMGNKHNVNWQSTKPQSDMSIGCMLHFRRDISYNTGIIPALNPTG